MLSPTASPSRHSRRRSSLTGLGLGLGLGLGGSATSTAQPVAAVVQNAAQPHVAQPSPLSRRLSLASLSLTFSSSSSSIATEKISPTSAAAHNNPISPTNAESTPRGFADIFNVFKRDKHAVWWGIPETDEIKRLESILADRDIRNDIVMDLLAAHSEFVLPIRFIVLYNEYWATHDRKERQMKGRKILSTFFQVGSMFQLRSIPEEDLVHVRMEHLGMVKTYLLSELVKMPVIIEYCAKVDRDDEISTAEGTSSEQSSSASLFDI